MNNGNDYDSQSGGGSFTSGDNAVSNVISFGKDLIQANSGPEGTWTQSSLSNPSKLQLRTCFSYWGPVSNVNGAGVAPNANVTLGSLGLGKAP